VPKPYADYIVLDILKQSGGAAVAVSDEEIFRGVKEWASKEGLFASPEGAACVPAYQRLLREGFLKPRDKVVIFNTGSGLKYIDVVAAALKIGTAEPASNALA
jgi:threonine synthase